MTVVSKITRSEVVANQGPFFGGGYRATVFNGKQVIATARFDVPESHRTWSGVIEGGEIAYKNCKKWLAGFGQ